MANTDKQYDEAVKVCKDIFEKKMTDYGTAWRVLRTSSLTDQLFIKAKRIRTLQENGFSKVDEGIYDEFIGIVNYSTMALIQLDLGYSDHFEMNPIDAKSKYAHYVEKAKSLMMNKNHDYDEAWRDMRVSSLADLILQKILRVKQIEDNKGKTLISEGIDANYLDMINYAVFALIHLNSEKQN